MKNLKIILAAIIMVASQFAFAQSEDKPKLEINGFVRNYTGILLESPNDFSIIQNTMNLELRRQNEKVGFYVNPYLYQYPKGEIDLGIREMYIDFFSDKFDIRIGKQQIIWGQADGVFITDIVSPKNLTEFLLWDFSEIRMGVTALKFNYYINDANSIELVGIPNFQPTILPASGSIWRPSTAFPVPATFDYSKQDIVLQVDNSEFFAKYSLSTSSIDLQLIAGYTWDDDPTMHIFKTIDPNTMQLSGLTIQPQHHRLGLTGGSFSVDIAGFILRGEGAYYFDKQFQTEDPSASGALAERNYINYVIGLDKTIGDWKFSGQFIQKTILNYDDLIQNDQFDNLATLMVNRTLFREKVRLELFSYFGLNNQDAFVRFRAFYFPQDAVGLELGTNLFFGEEGTFGQYDKNDMIYARIKYSF